MQPLVFDIASLNVSTILPMAIVLVGALFILIVDLFKKYDKEFYVVVSMGVLIADIYLLLSDGVVGRGFFDLMLLDGVSVASQLIILVGSLIFVPLAISGKRFIEFSFAEYFALFLFMVAGFQFMVSTDNLILIFVGLETGSLALYELIAMHNRQKSIESAVKYFTMGAYAAGMYAFSAMIFYALSGSVEIHIIKDVLIGNGFEKVGLILLASALMIASLGFKLSLVPFHTWTPDVYEGASAPLAGYMSIVPKIAGLVVVMRLFDFLAASDNTVIYTLLWVVAVATMTIGNVVALVQDDVKRMLAYSSVSHSGFVLTAVVIGSTQAYSGLFLYWFMFLFTNFGAFTILWISRHPTKGHHSRFDHPYTKFAGMIKKDPAGAVIMALFMFSLAGVPPFAVYWGKIYMISAAVNSGHIILAMIMALNSAIAIYYYLKLVVYMFLKEANENDGTVYQQNNTFSLKVVLTVAGVFVLVSSFVVSPVLEFVEPLLVSSGF
jgi:NADH-quinone oxidoreductase subunit N